MTILNPVKTVLLPTQLSTLLKLRKSANFNRTLIKFKDGAYYCYCAYVLRISRHSDFLSTVLFNTGIFLRGLKLPRKQNLASALGIQKEFWG